MVTTIEQALEKIAELESENKALREEIERYKNITPAGRKKHVLFVIESKITFPKIFSSLSLNFISNLLPKFSIVPNTFNNVPSIIPILKLIISM